MIWTWILAMVLGPTAYAFGAMLLALVSGLAIGAALASTFLVRTRHAGAWLGVALVVAAFAALGAALLVDRLPLIMAAAVTSPGAGFASVVRLQVTLGIAVQLPMTLALGAAFPLALAHAAPAAGDAPRSAARIYAANTAGAIAGALAASFVLVPALGLQTSLRLAAALTIAAGLVVCWATTPRTRRFAVAAASLALLGNRPYDVIISEPSNPWMAGVASLFTREFFTAARGRLSAGGIFCQWAHTYNISDADLRSITATFLDTFPNGSAWLVGVSDLLLIGSHEPIAALDRGIEAAWGRPGVAADLEAVSVRDAYSLLTLFLAQGADLKRYASGGVIQTDAALSLEYSAPRAVYGRFQEANVAALRAAEAIARRPSAVRLVETTPTAAQRRNRGIMRLRADAPVTAYDDFGAAIRQSPRDVDALDGLVRTATRTGRMNEAEQILREVAAATPNAPALVALSKLLAMRGQSDEAANVARDAALVDPNDASALHQLGAMYAERGDQDALAQLERIVESSPAHRAVALYYAARLAVLRADLPAAAVAASELVMLKRDVEALTLIGTIQTEMGQYADAREALEESLVLVPRDAAVLANLGIVELRSGNTAKAAERFSEALFLQPTYAPALTGLAQATGITKE